MKRRASGSTDGSGEGPHAGRCQAGRHGGRLQAVWSAGRESARPTHPTLRGQGRGLRRGGSHSRRVCAPGTQSAPSPRREGRGGTRPSRGDVARVRSVSPGSANQPDAGARPEPRRHVGLAGSPAGRRGGSGLQVQIRLPGLEDYLRRRGRRGWSQPSRGRKQAQASGLA